MNKLKSLKGQKGFTLVEVIVVAIIVAALAGVAIPMYTSYVTSSRNNAAANAAGSVASYMGSCLNQQGCIGAAGTAYTYDGVAASPTITCTIGGVAGATMKLPQGIKVVVSDMCGTGTVTTNNPPTTGAPQVYSY